MYQHHPTGRRAAAPASKIREYRPPGQLGQELTDRFKPPRHKLPRLAVYNEINCPQRVDGFGPEGKNCSRTGLPICIHTYADICRRL